MGLVLRISKRNYNIIMEPISEALGKGAVIVYPTETCYGIGCIVENKEAVKKVYEIKKRSRKKALPIIVSDLGMAGKYCYITRDAERLVRKFMPGPLSLVVRKKKRVPDIVSKGTVSFRISSNEFAGDLCKKLGKALVATSANIEGEAEIYSGEEVIRQFMDKADIVVVQGDLRKRMPSTVFDVEKGKVLRKGPVSWREIKKALA